MQPPRTFETSRLILLPPTPADAAAIFAQYAQDPEVTRYLTWQSHESVEVTEGFVRRCVECWKSGAAYPWAIIYKPEGQLIGMIELRLHPPNADIGYALARAYWGQGLMTEAALAVVDWALAQPEVTRVWAICDVENVASARVMQKVGMQRETLLPGELVRPTLGETPRDCWRYAKVK
jgi:RimJ/RimL family protein N-acetyltransferase